MTDIETLLTRIRAIGRRMHSEPNPLVRCELWLKHNAACAELRAEVARVTRMHALAPSAPRMDGGI